MAIDLSLLLTHDLQLDPSACAGQVIVVTGAGRGIGFQTARAFALLGGKVVLAELSEAGRAAEEQIRMAMKCWNALVSLKHWLHQLPMKPWRELTLPNGLSWSGNWVKF